MTTPKRVRAITMGEDVSHWNVFYWDGSAERNTSTITTAMREYWAEYFARRA